MIETERADSSLVATGDREKIKKHLFIKDLKPKDEVRTTFLVKSKELFSNKNGKPYLSLLLSDKTGEIDTRIWEDAEALSATFKEGDIVAIGGRTHLFQNRMQLVVEHLVVVNPQEIRLEDYLKTSEHNLETLYAELLETFRGLKNPWIRSLGLKLLEDPEIATRYKVCPAAKTIHHAFVGGLLVHSLQLIKLVDAVLPLYENLNRDILIFGAAFHDFGKIYELHYQGKMGYTDEGKLVGHITIGAILIDRKIQELPGFPLELDWELKHMVLSHHGKLEYGSPKKPATLEADILAHLDLFDSRVNSIQTLIESDRTEGGWTAYHKAYDQYYQKPRPLSPPGESGPEVGN